MIEAKSRVRSIRVGYGQGGAPGLYYEADSGGFIGNQHQLEDFEGYYGVEIIEPLRTNLCEAWKQFTLAYAKGQGLWIWNDSGGQLFVARKI